jgi:hypothetical protein
MNRRSVLTGATVGIAMATSGCVDTVITSGVGSPDHPGDDPGQHDPEDVGLRILGVYPAETDRDFIDGEYLLFENDSAASLDVSGYTVAYPSSHTHLLRDLVLDPGSQLILLSRNGEDATLQMSPPAYLRYAGVTSESNPSALGSSGTVRVRNTAGRTVAEATYSDTGCDGPPAENLECLHH